MTRLRTALLAGIAMLLLATAPAAAITYGQPDGNGHPYVGFMIFFDASYPGWFSCSGTLLDETTFLSAGHCTVDIGTNGADEGRTGGNDVWVTFASTKVLENWPARKDFATEAALYAARSTWLGGHGFVRGTAHPNPAYDDFASFPITNDVGIVKLGTTVNMSRYGVLAPIGTVDDMAAVAKNKNKVLIETVGYGIQSIEPKPMDEETRYRSTSRIVEINGNASKGGNLHTLNNPSPIGGTGGSCFGDSGGPLFVEGTNMVVAVVSWGNSGTCHGADYSWRVDTTSAQSFITGWMED